ncbi:MAG: EthD domain-containing protein [Gammaproteobacteria bacterium]
MFKVMILIKRKPGMSMEEFIDYYETRHAPLGASKVPNLKRYVRHFVRPYGNAVYQADSDAPCDVLTELWFDDEADFERGMAYLTEPETAAIIAADEEQLFDRASIRFMIMEDHETELGAR